MHGIYKIASMFQFIVVATTQIYWMVVLANSGQNIYTKTIIIYTTPVFVLLSSFFMYYLINVVYNLIVPKPWIECNSQYLTFFESQYIKDTETKNILTVQIPVYTEPFEIIQKTLLQLINACEYHNENFLSKTNILVCEDGLQCIDEEKRKERIDFYMKYFPLVHFIARPKENRRGKFKKASNLNFCLNFLKSYCNLNRENVLHSSLFCSSYNLEDCDFALGKHILLVDSDTEINVESLHKILNEFTDPRVAYLQCRTNALITDPKNKWEHIIAHFTDAIYDISFLYTCSNGNPPPVSRSQLYF